MNRGYIKFWRKAQDSESWNRGLMYQGLIINILSRAEWKKSSYQGRDLAPGQFCTVVSGFAKELNVPRTTLQRMLTHLEEDGFIKVENVGNRFVVITIINWHSYQVSEKENGQRLPGGQPMVNHDSGNRATENATKTNGENGNVDTENCNVVNHWATAGCPCGQPSYKEEEVKKKNINTPPTPPCGGSESATRQDADPAQVDRPPASVDASGSRQDAGAPAVVELSLPGSGHIPSPETGQEKPRRRQRATKGADLPPYSDEFEAVWLVFPKKVNKGEAWRAYHGLQQAGVLPENMPDRVANRALEPDWGDPARLRYVPNMSTWLHRRGWEDEGCFPPAPDPRNTPEDERRNEIMGRFNFGMLEPGETLEEALLKNTRMEEALAAEGL